MTGKQVAHLVRMANQIAINLGAGRDIDETGRLTAEHMRKFWTCDMRTQLAAHARQPGDDLLPAVRRALSDDEELGET